MQPPKLIKYTLLLLAGIFGANFHLAAASRSLCNDFYFTPNVTITVPNSVDCGGTSNYGALTITTNWTLAGCRGCGHKLAISFTTSFEAARLGSSNTVSGWSGAGEYAVIYFPNDYYAQVFWNGNETNVATTNYSLSCQPSSDWWLAASPATSHAGDVLTINYYTRDGTNHKDLGMSLDEVFSWEDTDDAGEITLTDENGSVTSSAPADGRSKVFAQVTDSSAFPDDVRTWQIDGGTDEETLGCTIDPHTGIITVGKHPGTITVRVYCSDTPDCWIEKDLQIGCSTCGDAGCIDDDVDLGSVKVTINAGNSSFGKSAGQFVIAEAYPSRGLSTPSTLKYYSGSLNTNDVVVTRSNGIIQSILAPQISASVISNSPYQYQIRFYTNTTFTGTPVTTWAIMNPDGASSSNRLSIIKTNGSLITQYDYAWDGTLNGWALTTQGGAKVAKRYNSTNGVLRTETHLIFDGSSNLKYQETNVYQTFAWGEELVQNVKGTGANALKTTWSFYTNSADTNNYGHLYQTVDSSGHWERYSYNSGRMARKVMQYLDGVLPSSTAQENSNRVTIYSYSPNVVFVTNFLRANEISWTKRETYGNETLETVKQSSDPSSSSGNLLTYTWRNTTPLFSGEPLQELRPDGTMTFYDYQISSDGNFRTNTITTGKTYAQGYVIDGTKTITALNKSGSIISQKTYDVASGLLTSSATTLSVDTRGRPTQLQYLDGTTTTTVYGCCGVDSYTDREGTTTSYSYDPYTKQVTDVTQAGITTHYDYDAAGNLIQTTRIGTDNFPIVQNVSTFDTAGRQLSSTFGGGTNTYSETYDGSGYRVNTTTYPDGSTRIETYYQDGSLLSVSGTEVAPMQYSYGLSTTTGKYGEFTKEIRLGSSGQTNEWTTTYRDSLGRNFLTVYAAASGTPSDTSYFNDQGQLSKRIDPDGVTTLFQFNGKGEQEYEVIDMDGDANIDFAGTDRITRTTRDVITDHGTTVFRTLTFVWATNGVNASNLVSTIEESADGLQSWSTIWNNGVAVTTYLSTVLPGSGYRVQTAVASDNSYTVTTNRFGSPISVTQFDADGAPLNQTTYGYDPHGRLNTETDARIGTTTAYYDDADNVTNTVAPAPGAGQSQPSSRFFYDAMNRNWKTTLPDTTSVTNQFTPFGAVTLNTGSRVYPAGFGYDAQSRTKVTTNWSGFPSLGARVTTWNYDGYRGWITNKVYEGNTAGPAYSYTSAGRLATRKWARGVTATYSRNDAGEVTSISYTGDSTPDVDLGFDRCGRQSGITNGADKTLFTHNDAGQLLLETNSGGTLAGISIGSGYNQTLFRTNLAVRSATSNVLSVTYVPDAASRLRAVSNGTNAAAYAYVTSSPLVSQMFFTNGGALRLTRSNQFDNWNRPTEIAWKAGATTVASFSYQYNLANQRTRMTLADGSYWQYRYDFLGQLTNATHYWRDATPVAGQQFAFSFDDIGNRKWCSKDSRLANYTNNTLNQLTSREIPGWLNIIGSAHSNAAVTLWGTNYLFVPTTRKGEYFRSEVPIANTSGPVWLTLTNMAILQTGGTNKDWIATSVGSSFIPQTPEVFAHDGDGNRTGDGRWTNTWDGENRLVTMTPLANSPLSVKRKLDFTYDYMNRRIEKIVSTNRNNGWTSESDTKFVWDGWNLIGILDGNNTLLYSITWGKDFDGSDIPLMFTVNSGTNAGTYLYCLDANHNVLALVDSANGAIAGQWEYDPFLFVLRATGPLAKLNPLLGASQFYDWETGFYYYCNRYYDQNSGRFLSRDLIEEQGGRNLYGFTANDPINHVDLLGLTIECRCLEDYLKQNGIAADMYKKNGNIYSATSGANPATYTGLILWKMLQSTYNFKAAGLELQNLQQNITARRAIVWNAITANFRFNTGQHVSTVGAIEDPQQFFNEHNDGKTTLACQALSELIFRTGNGARPQGKRNYDGVWVPGDWGYIKNRAYTDDGDWRDKDGRDRGLQGENIFNTGENLFWGHFISGRHRAQSKEIWFTKIQNWTSRSGKRGDPDWREYVIFTTTGLE